MRRADDILKDPPFWSKTSWIQLGYSLWVNQVGILVGSALAFSAVALPQLRLPKARFSPTPNAEPWIASVLLLCAPIGCIISGFALDRIGRRLTLVFCMVPMIIGWFCTGSAFSVTHMIVGRVITGIGVGLCIGAPRTFCTEITLPNIRGIAGIIPIFAVGIGILSQTIIGAAYNWSTSCYISGSYSIILMTLNFFLPETPYFVLLSGDMVKTMRALRRIRAQEFDSDRELEEMRHFQIHNHIRKLPTKDMIWELGKPYAYKPFLTIMGYVIIGQMAGISIIMFWTVDILKASRSSLDPYVGNSILGATRLCVSVSMAVLIFWVRRRVLAITSALGLGLLCIALGAFLTSKPSPTIYPQLAYMLYMVLACLGYYSLPLMMMYELVPLQIRGFMGGIATSVIFIMMFTANQIFPVLQTKVSMSGTIIIFGISSLIETKGLTLQDIEEFYRGKRCSLERQSAIILPRGSMSKSAPRIEQDETSDERPIPLKKRTSSVTFLINNKRTSPGSIESSSENLRVKQENTTEENTTEENTTQENTLENQNTTISS